MSLAVAILTGRIRLSCVGRGCWTVRSRRKDGSTSDLVRGFGRALGLAREVCRAYIADGEAKK